MYLKPTLTALLILLAPALPTEAMASCSDRPGTPIDVRGNLNPGSQSLARFTWVNTAREQVCWDMEVTDGNRVVEASNGACRGPTNKGVRYENSYPIIENSTLCFRVRARTMPGSEGCVSQVWSNQACVTSGRGTPLAYGPDACKVPFVWREVVPSDHVCVDPHIRDQVKRENAEGPGRRSPTGGASGPDTCKPGSVWREAFADDHVCVAPEVRARTTRENQAAAANKVQP